MAKAKTTAKQAKVNSKIAKSDSVTRILDTIIANNAHTSKALTRLVAATDKDQQLDTEIRKTLQQAEINNDVTGRAARMLKQQQASLLKGKK